MSTKNELEAILKKQHELESIFNETKKAGIDLRNKLAREQGQLLFKKLDAFAKLFSSGPVGKAFDEVTEILEALEGYDSGYVNTLGGADPYGVKSTPAVKYFVAQLFGGPLKKDANLWDVLNRVSSTYKQAGCPFVGNE